MKAGLLDLVDHAVAQGWPHTRACCLLGVSDVRVHRWRARMASGAQLDDQAPGGNPVHRLLAWEEKAILKLVDEWAEVDHSHRKLAHRGSYTGEVFVSPSTLLRVLDRHKICTQVKAHLIVADISKRSYPKFPSSLKRAQKRCRSAGRGDATKKFGLSYYPQSRTEGCRPSGGEH